MNIYKRVLGAVLLTAMAYTPGAAEELVLSREQCLEIALRDNPTVRVADMEIKKVDYSKKEVIAGLFPSVDFSANYQRSIELQTIRMNMGARARN